TLRGIVHTVGTEPPDVVLMTDHPIHSFFLRSSSIAVLRKLDGLGIEVIGRMSGQNLTVDRFIVTSANGLPATDGRLSLAGDALVLTTADGRRYPLVHPSPTLRANVGARVWVAGPISQEPVSYGIIGR